MTNRAVLALVAIAALLVLAYLARSPDVAETPAEAPAASDQAQPATAAQPTADGAPAAPAPPMPMDHAMPGMDHAMPGMDHAMPAPQAAKEASEAAGGHGGHDMRPIDASSAPEMPASAQGNLPLPGQLIDGVRVFDLTARVVQWHILPDVKVAAYVYNDQMPGPQLRMKPGEKVRINFKNELPEATSIHWHGLIIDISMDGVPYVSQDPVQPGGSFVYEFVVPNTPGTYFYHTHMAVDRQDALGLHGALIIEDGPAGPKYAVDHVVMLGEHRVVNGQTHPAMEFDGMLPNYFTINGKAFPATQSVKAKVGDKLLFRFVGSGQFIHPMHIHGGPFEIVATDGYPVPPAARLLKDTVLVGPGERYDVVWTARKPGKWMMHCHIAHHITNDGKEVMGAGGLTTVIEILP